jgi:hypothetical protein
LAAIACAEEDHLPPRETDLFSQISSCYFGSE